MQSILIALLLLWSTTLAVGNAIVQPPIFTTARLFANTSSRVAIPFGSLDDFRLSEPLASSLIQTAEIEFDPKNIATDAAWAKYSAKGRWYGCLLDMQDEPCGRALGDVRSPPSAESVWQGDLRRTCVTSGTLCAVLISSRNNHHLGLARCLLRPRPGLQFSG